MLETKFGDDSQDQKDLVSQMICYLGGSTRIWLFKCSKTKLKKYIFLKLVSAIFHQFFIFN